MSVMYIRNEQTGKFEPVPSLVGPQGKKGDTGITPNLQVGTVTTGNPGTSAEVTITGTPEEPVLNFKIPKGEPGTDGEGSGTVSYINHKGPDDAGNVTLAAGDVGAVPDTRRVNSKPLSTDIELSAEDIGARPDTWTPTASDVGAVPDTRKINNMPLSSDVTLSAENVSAVPITRTVNGKELSEDVTLTSEDVSAVPTTRKVNDKPLSEDVTITSEDVGAVPTTRTVNGKALSTDITLTNDDVNAVPTTRKVNDKPLSSDITLSGADMNVSPTDNRTLAEAIQDASESGSSEPEVAVSTTEPKGEGILLWVDTAGSPNTKASISDIEGLEEALANAGSVKRVAGKSPDSEGNITLIASDVGALATGGTAADSAKLGGKGPEYYLQPRNLLDNSDFRNPVNQRGVNTISTYWGMFIDRWYVSSISHDSSVTASASISENGITVASASNGIVALLQRLPGNALTSEKAYTAVMRKSDGTLIFGSVSNHVSDLGFWQIEFRLNNGGIVVWAALYEGTFTADTLPPYVPKGYAAELAECRGYYRKNIQSVLYCYANSYLFPFVMETPMHRVPTYNITAAYTSAWGEISGDITMSPATVYGVNTFTNSNFKAGQYYRLFIEVNADL